MCTHTSNSQIVHLGSNSQWWTVREDLVYSIHLLEYNRMDYRCQFGIVRGVKALFHNVSFALNQHPCSKGNTNTKPETELTRLPES